MQHELVYTHLPDFNSSNRKIYLQVGTADTTVGLNVMTQLQRQLTQFANSSHITLIIARARHILSRQTLTPSQNPCSMATSLHQTVAAAAY
ncbi:hypothetical protein CNMCM7691_004102 [Aspergillus felis]|uniref:Uncharacterized protein n=1 Tax=Aspergillus felis TaxID=1287682 RepID=A0A8H6R4L5_9EURO|nr:hypothetical protein CNMCM7691_004102 [Aspergillus felis]